MEAVINIYFLTVKQGKSSHEFKCAHPALAEHPLFAPTGGMSIPVTNGRFVKPVYTKRLAKAIQLIIDSKPDEASGSANPSKEKFDK